MLVVGIIFSIGLLGAIIYFAVSPKSSKLVRLSAIGALGLIILALLISGFFIIKGPAEDEDVIPLPVFQDSGTVEVKRPFRVLDVSIIGALLLILAVVIVKALRDQKKAEKIPPAAGKSLSLPESALGSDIEESKPLVVDDDDSFDLDDIMGSK